MSFRTSMRVLALLMLLSAGALIAQHAAQPKPCAGHCNVIFIVIDTLSADHIALYGYDRDTMPLTTNFFLEHGQIFDDVSAVAPWTFESFSSMYFSDVPSHITFADLTGASKRTSVFSALRDAAVTIRGINLLNTGSFILDGIYAPILPSERISAPHIGNATTFDKWTTLESELYGTRLEAEALGASNTPFMTFTHVLSIHDPYDPEGSFTGLFASSTKTDDIYTNDLLAVNATTTSPSAEKIALYRLRYDQGIAQTDALLGAFFAHLSTSTLADTAIVITADHGEAFYGHGHVYHGLSLYKSETHVPLFVYVPGLAPRRISTPASLIDIAPTILDLEGVAVPQRFTGKSLLPAILHGSWPDNRMLPLQNGYPYFLDTHAVQTHAGVPSTLEHIGAATSTKTLLDLSDIGVRYGTYKLIGKPGTSTLELYNLATDPREQHNMLPTFSTPGQFDIYLTMLAKYRMLAK